jgi:thymidine phosphorylase
MTLFADEADRFERAYEALEGAIEVGPAGSPIYRLPLVIDRLT